MKTFLSIILPIFFLLTACQTSTLDSLNDVIYVRHQGADMPAYIHGNASEKVFLIVLHGAGSYGLSFRDGVFVDELEERFAVVYWDQRAQSMSQGNFEKPENIVDLMADDVMALVAVLKEKYGEDISLFLMGHSWGGALGTAVLVKDNQQSNFKGWISVDGAHDFPFSGTARRRLLLSMAEEQILEGNEVEGWSKLHEEVSFLDSTSEEDYSTILYKGVDAMEYLLAADVVNHGNSSAKIRRALIDNNPITWKINSVFHQPFQEAIDMDYSLSDQMGKITIPSLLIWGKYDFSVPPTLGQDALRRLGSWDKQLVIFHRSIHHPHDTEPESFGLAVSSFVGRLK